MHSIPVILIFGILSVSTPLQLIQTIHLTANPLAIDANAKTGQMLISLDTVHEVGSTNAMRSDYGAISLLSFSFAGSGWVEDSLQFEHEVVVADAESSKGLDGLYYGLGNLRKRGGEE